MENIELQNTRVKSWGSQSLQEIKNKYISMVRSPNRSGDGLDSLKLRTRKTSGEISQVIFGFNRYLVFVHKGAGAGAGGSKGSTWFNNGARVQTRSSSLGKMNTGNRHKKEFLNPVLNTQIPKLADIIAGFKADAVIKAIQIK